MSMKLSCNLESIFGCGFPFCIVLLFCPSKAAILLVQYSSAKPAQRNILSVYLKHSFRYINFDYSFGLIPGVYETLLFEYCCEYTCFQFSC